MSIPKYDEMYRALLDCLADGQSHKSKEVKDAVARVFSVSEKERAELLPSGKQRLFDNRIGWTWTYLKKAGLVQSPSVRWLDKVLQKGCSSRPLSSQKKHVNMQRNSTPQRLCSSMVLRWLN